MGTDPSVSRVNCTDCPGIPTEFPKLTLQAEVVTVFVLELRLCSRLPRPQLLEDLVSDVLVASLDC